MIVRAACGRRSRCGACFPFADFVSACFLDAGDSSCSDDVVTDVVVVAVITEATAAAFLIPFFIPEYVVVDDDCCCRPFTLKEFVL